MTKKSLSFVVIKPSSRVTFVQIAGNPDPVVRGSEAKVTITWNGDRIEAIILEEDSPVDSTLAINVGEGINAGERIG